MNDMGGEVRKEQDCFAYKNGKCNILRINKCEGSGCGFYKTSEQLEKDRQQAFLRIQSLDEATRRDINETYFSGKLNEMLVEQN